MITKQKHARLKTLATILVMSVAVGQLAGCGGGGGGADTKTGFGGSGDPGATADALNAGGPFSSVGTAGIAATGLDDRASTIFINTLASQSFTALKLGMVAEVTGTIPVSSTSTTAGTATNIVVQSAVVGLVSAVDVVNQRITVLPLTVQVDQNTIFEGFNSMTTLALGTRIEAYGMPQADSKTILATRLIALPAVAGAPVELVGTATNVSAFQITVQGVPVSLGSLSSVTTPSGTVAGTASIVENTRVRVLGSYSANTNSMLATQIVTGIPAARNDNAILVLDGIVQSVGANGRFRLNDTDVDTTAANAATIAAGARVQVKGRKTSGVIAATDFRRIAAGERIQLVVQGDIANFASIASFTVRGETINATSATFVGGTAANLANGRTVRIKVQANAGRLEATEVSFVTS